MNNPVPPAPGFRIKTLGCRVNQYESESIEAALGAKGWLPAESGRIPALCIVNTCTVTARAAMQSRQAVRHAIRQFPAAAVVVTGCHAQSEPQVFAEIPGVDLIVGNSEKHRLPELISQGFSLNRQKPAIYCSSASLLRELPPTALPIVGGRARPYLKIQDGCGDFCTYCIVPYTRGPSRSLPPARVMEMIAALARQGARETVLTGIHLGRYGMELSPPTSLLSLLNRIDSEDAMERVRLSSIEPKELTDGIIEMAARNERFCPHFHIPLQSGDRGILEKMKRPYTPELFQGLVSRIHDNIADAAIGADVLVGFPGEDAAAFENTCSLLASLPVTYLHVFPFSPRPGTPAARFSGQVPAPVIKDRCRRLRHLSQSKKAAFYQAQTGRQVDVILENRRDPSSGCLKGVSANYLTVLTNGPDHYRNCHVRCRLTGPVLPEGIMGRIVE